MELQSWRGDFLFTFKEIFWKKDKNIVAKLLINKEMYIKLLKTACK